MAVTVTFTFDAETVSKLERLGARNKSEYLRGLIAREFDALYPAAASVTVSVETVTVERAADPALYQAGLEG